MKRLSLIALTVLIYFACSKNQNGITEQELQSTSLIGEAKSFFLNELKSGEQTAQVSVNGNHSNRPDLLRDFNKKADWNIAKVINVPGKGQVVVVPIEFDGNIAARPSFDDSSVRIPVNNIARLVIFKDSSSKLHYVVASYYGDSSFISGNSSNSFTGVALLQDWRGNFIRGFKFERNKIYGIKSPDSTSVASDTIQVNIPKPPDGEYTTQTCTYMDYYTCTFSSDGQSYCNPQPSQTLLLGCTYTFLTINYGSTSLSTSNVTYLAPSGGAPIASKVITDSIYSELNNICMQKVLDHIRFDNIKTSIYRELQKAFANTEYFNATFETTASLPDITADARTTASKSGQYLNMRITMNLQRLLSSNQEYLAATMYHEMIHAYLDANTGKYDELTQHVAIFTTMIGDQVTALIAAYPSLSSHDAECLVISGFSDIQATYPTLFNAALTANNLTLDDCRFTSESYRLGGTGTKCSAAVPGPAI